MHRVNHQGKCSLQMSDKSRRNSGIRNIGSSITMIKYKEAIEDIKCHKVQRSGPLNDNVREGIERIIIYIYAIYNIQIYTFVCTCR